MKKNDTYYMEKALFQAKKAYNNNEVPIGAIIVKNNKIISSSYNEKHNKKIATKHAEMIVIEKACRKLKTWQLKDCTLYVTLEPCLMCIGAILESRIKKVVYSINSNKYGFTGFFDENKIKNKIEIKSGVLAKESSELLKSFFEMKRD